jgi:hypothetical protein
MVYVQCSKMKEVLKRLSKPSVDQPLMHTHQADHEAYVWYGLYEKRRKCYLYSVPDTPGSLFIYRFTGILQILVVDILHQRENHSKSAVQNLHHTV